MIALHPSSHVNLISAVVHSAQCILFCILFMREIHVHSFSLLLNFVRFRRVRDDFKSELGVAAVLGGLGCFVVPESTATFESWQENSWRQWIQIGGWR